MKVVVCGSVESVAKNLAVVEGLKQLGHEVEIPRTVQMILAGEVSLAKFTADKEAAGDLKYREMAEEDLIIRYYRLIEKAEAILVINVDKRGIKNYVGGNAFLEVGFAYVLGKKIFFLNDIPEIPYYRDELRAMKPIILRGDLTKI